MVGKAVGVSVTVCNWSVEMGHSFGKQAASTRASSRSACDKGERVSH